MHGCASQALNLNSDMSTKKKIAVSAGEEKLCTNKEPAPGQCNFFVSRKNRFCKMTVKEGRRFCGEHSNVIPDQGEERVLRVPCPLDNKHSCCLHMLQKHLKKCNARIDVHPQYVVRDINRGLNADPCVKNSLSSVEDETLSQIINKVNTAEFPSIITTDVKSHPLVEKELSCEKYGQSTLKHLLQNASLLGHLLVLNVFNPGTCFIEFGAGRGQLSYWIGEFMAQKNSPCLLVPVDRASNRHKYDNKLRSQDLILVHRLRVDIADLCLAKVPQVTTAPSVVAVCKHLCGVATDLALRCLTNANLNNLKVILMTPCCHHRIEWESFVGQETFVSMGFSREEFAVITSLASWATCGQSNFNRGASLKTAARFTTLGLSPEDQENLGRRCKLLLDYCRLIYLQKRSFSYFTMAPMHLLWCSRELAEFPGIGELKGYCVYDKSCPKHRKLVCVRQNHWITYTVRHKVLPPLFFCIRCGDFSYISGREQTFCDADSDGGECIFVNRRANTAL